MPAVTAPVPALNTPNFSLYYHPDDRIVHHEIRRFVTGQDFRDLLMAGAGPASTALAGPLVRRLPPIAPYRRGQIDDARGGVF